MTHLHVQIYISVNKLTCQKTNLHFRKQINRTQNTEIFATWNLQVPKHFPKQIYK